MCTGHSGSLSGGELLHSAYPAAVQTQRSVYSGTDGGSGALVEHSGNGGEVTVQSLVGGAVTGLASTGMRQIFEIFIEKKEANHETKGQDS